MKSKSHFNSQQMLPLRSIMEECFLPLGPFLNPHGEKETKWLPSGLNVVYPHVLHVRSFSSNVSKGTIKEHK